ncbi:DUF6518 family protein [Streptomyces sp. NPDC086077]|uniref:DUF6518 family protein n=1 Tax=Streptomyces sp. NPDC086077 TaxID=3154862 RepID=UPI00341F5B3E
MFAYRSQVLTLGAALAVGITFGVLAPVLEARESPVLHALHLTLAAGWSWAALSFFVGISCASKKMSATLGAVSLTVAVLAYYTTKAQRGEYRSPVDLSSPSSGVYFNWMEFGSKIGFWCVIGLIAGTILGLAGNMSRRPGTQGLALQLLIPLIALAETTMRIATEASSQGAVADATWNITRGAAVAACFLLIGRAISTRRRSPVQMSRK